MFINKNDFLFLQDDEGRRYIYKIIELNERCIDEYGMGNIADYDILLKSFYNGLERFNLSICSWFKTLNGQYIHSRKNRYKIISCVNVKRLFHFIKKDDVILLSKFGNENIDLRLRVMENGTFNEIWCMSEKDKKDKKLDHYLKQGYTIVNIIANTECLCPFGYPLEEEFYEEQCFVYY